MLVCDALNRLPDPTDLASNMPFVEKCCPDCCAPCDLLRELLRVGTLDEIVRWAPRHLWQNVSWWTPQGVNKQWLADCWECTSIPKCERVGTA